MTAPHRAAARHARALETVQQINEAQQEQLDRIEAKLDAVLSLLKSLKAQRRKGADDGSDD